MPNPAWTLSRPAVARRSMPVPGLVALSLLALLPAAAALTASPRPAAAQGVNQITAVEPESASQGTSGLLVTFTLDADAPPAPPAGVLPSSVTIGTMAGSLVTHDSQYVVTAVVSIPGEEPAGAKDATVIFPTPGGGTVTFSRAGGFTVTIGGDLPPAITRHPVSQTVPPGGAVTFTVAASGTEPLRYQWQKDGADLGGATSAAHTIDPVTEADAGAYRCIVSNDYGSATSDDAALTVVELPAGGYPVVDTGQVLCYSDLIEIACPPAGEPFYGQDSQCDGNAPAFAVSADGLTVQDAVTGLSWQRSPDTNGDGSITAADKLTWSQAQARPSALNAAAYGGFTDWRLPTIKELYSLIDFRGTDPSGLQGDDTSGLTPFIDTDYFRFAYGQISAGERIIDAQYASSNLYVGPIQGSEGGKLFGVNFADGRIKGYGLRLGGADKTFFVQCVRGNPAYGVSIYLDHGDGTVSDLATGLCWATDDSGAALTWEEALAFVQAKNAANHLGRSDWRLPDAKELQSLVDYTRAPDAVDPARRGAAIDPLFHCSEITGEACAVDSPWYWTGTTHGNYLGTGTWGAYVCFGRSMGYMNGAWVDVHGAGSQRSDPKSGSLSGFAHADCGYYNSQAPQGDAIRIRHHVRLVRDDGDTGGAGSEFPPAGTPGSVPAILAAPNPGRGGTVFRLDLPVAAPVRLVLHDVAGRQVAVLLDAVLPAGTRWIPWNGSDMEGRPLASGLYHARLRSGEDRAGASVARILLLR